MENIVSSDIDGADVSISAQEQQTLIEVLKEWRDTQNAYAQALKALRAAERQKAKSDKVEAKQAKTNVINDFLAARDAYVREYGEAMESIDNAMQILRSKIMFARSDIMVYKGDKSYKDMYNLHMKIVQGYTRELNKANKNGDKKKAAAVLAELNEHESDFANSPAGQSFFSTRDRIRAAKDSIKENKAKIRDLREKRSDIRKQFNLNIASNEVNKQQGLMEIGKTNKFKALMSKIAQKLGIKTTSPVQKAMQAQTDKFKGSIALLRNFMTKTTVGSIAKGTVEKYNDMKDKIVGKMITMIQQATVKADSKARNANAKLANLSKNENQQQPENETGEIVPIDPADSAPSAPGE